MKYQITKTTKVMFKGNFVSIITIITYLAVTVVLSSFLRAGELRLNHTQLTQLPLNDMHTGKKLMIADKPLYVVFWASWCVACKVELKHLKKGYQKYKSQILIVSLDKRIKNAQKFIRKLSLPFNSIYDQESRWKNLFGIESLPYGVILNPDGPKRWIVKRSSSKLLTIESLEKLLL